MSEHLAKITAELEKFNQLGHGQLLTAAEVTAAAASIEASFLPAERTLTPDSRFFDFTGKVQGMVAIMHPHLDLRRYLGLL